MVVPVLITSCHMSENWNIGLVMAHTRTTPTAIGKVWARPHWRAAPCAALSNTVLIRLTTVAPGIVLHDVIRPH
jgi:hypothetical protein